MRGLPIALLLLVVLLLLIGSAVAMSQLPTTVAGSYTSKSSSAHSFAGKLNLSSEAIPIQLLPNPPHTSTKELVEGVNETLPPVQKGLQLSNETILGPQNGTETKAESDSQPTEANNGNIQILFNHKVTVSSPSLVDEPSVANNVMAVFYVGNWYTARSTDGGVTWKYINTSSDMPFCYDQDVIYDPIHGIFLWYRQATITQNVDNYFRLGVSSNALDWWFYDAKPSDINNTWANQSFDYPHLAVGNKYLYISTNTIDKSKTLVRAIIVLILLQDLALHKNKVEYDYFYDRSIFQNTFTPVQGAT